MGNWRNRLAKNDRSRNKAENNRDEWTAHDDEMLIGLWGGEADLTDLAEILGRTREACRQRYYLLRRGEVITTTTIRTTTQTTTTRRPGWMDDPEQGSEWYT